MEYPGQFETHITITASTQDRISFLREWARQCGYRFHHIILDRGFTPQQPMVSRHSHGTLTSELAAAQALKNALEVEGFQVRRIKIEAATENADVPADDPGIDTVAAICHFEHHVKLLLPINAEDPRLFELARRHSAHLSRNALKVRTDGQEERFVTQRCYGIGRSTARLRLAALVRDLVAAGYLILKTEKEYVVYDSAPAVDHGWLDPEVHQ